MIKTSLLWIFTFLFTVGIAVYQRTTGPTYPLKGSVELGGNDIDFRLLRSHGGTSDAALEIEVPEKDISGTVVYNRYKSGEPSTEIPMKRKGDKLVARLPNQPPAGKLAYDVYLIHDENRIKLNEEPVIIRFKGAVPDYILIPHIILMFTAMLFSTRAGLEALLRRKRTLLYSTVTVITLFLGGLVLGPIVQNFAFGDYWTGWPFGQDMTDNKTLLSFLFWAFALYRVKRNKHHRTWVMIAAVVLLAIYLIPHSMFGSELNYESGQVETGKN